MRILHVASHHGVYRGGAVQLCRMAAEQRRRGHDVAVVVNTRNRDGDPATDADLATWDILKDDKIPVTAIDLTGRWAARRLRKAHDMESVEVIHVHRDEALIAAHAAIRKSQKLALIAQRGTVSEPPPEVAEIFASPRLNAIVAVAEAVRESVVAAAPAAREKTHVVYGSVDLQTFRPRNPDADVRAQLNLSENSIVVGSISAFRKAKRLDLLCRALAEVMPRHPNLYAAFIGARVTERVKPVAKALNISERCRFYEHQSNVADWLSVMHLTVVSASAREGLSGVLRESLAMEIPVVSTDCAGNREIVRDRETGLLIPPDDPAALASAIEYAIAHPDEMKTMARAGRAWVEAHCSLAAQADRLEAIYRTATG